MQQALVQIQRIAKASSDTTYEQLLEAWTASHDNMPRH
jgi:hypothetical protein